MDTILKAIAGMTAFGMLFGSPILYADMGSNMGSDQPLQQENKSGVNRLNLYLIGEALWWQANESDLEYGLLVKDTSNPSVGKYLNPHFNWDPGFRIGVGYHIPHDNWDINLQWTSFHTVGSDSVIASAEGGIDAIDAVFEDMFDQASNHLRIHLDFIDLEIGKNFNTSKWFSVRPFAGLRTQWIDQRNKIDYEGDQDLFSMLVNASTTFHNNNWGIGPRIGVNTNWMLFKDWSVFADLSASLLYGFFDLRAKYDDNLDGDVIDINIKDHYRITRTDTDIELGLKWCHTFDQKWALDFHIAWAHHTFFDQWKWGQQVPPTSNGTLSTSGINLGGRLDF